MKHLSAFFLLFIFCGFSFAQSQGVEISNLRVKEPIPGQMVSAGYLSITNHSAEVLTLLRVEANFASRVELHQTISMDGMNQMRPLQSVHIQPGMTVDFEPAGRHLMIMGLDRTAAAAELTFYFSNELEITQAVEWAQW